MTIETLESGIHRIAQHRFDISHWDGEPALLTPADIPAARILRLRRSGREQAGFRTLLLAQIDDINQRRAVLIWAADVRDQLGELEGADIYLLLLAGDGSAESPAAAEAMRRSFETNESFCRKFVVHQIVKRANKNDQRAESVEEFLSRTFLASPEIAQQGDKLVDPLSVALKEAAGPIGAWFNPSVQKEWLNVLVSDTKNAEAPFEPLLPPVRHEGDQG